MIHLDYRDVRPIYNQVYDAFRDQICAGVLQPGDKLPSVRELATQLAINPNTIQRAYRELEQDGWIGSMAGKGSFVCERVAGQVDAQPLWAQFDTVVGQLLNAGVSYEQMLIRMRREPNA